MMRSADERTEAVMQTMGFTLEELALNRDGRLSKRQRKSLRRYDFGRATKANEWLSIVFVERPLWTLIALLRQMMGKEVSMIEGVVRTSAERGYHTVSIGDQSFQVNREVLHSFEDGASYRLYYEAHPKTIVSYDVKRRSELLSAEAV